MTDYLQYQMVRLDDFFSKGQDMHQVNCHWDLFLETVGVSVCEIDQGDRRHPSLLCGGLLLESLGVTEEERKSQCWDMSALEG